MKKGLLVFVLCILCAIMAGCSSSGGKTDPPAVTEPATTKEPVTVDLDLSGMSGTVVYSQIYNLLSDPEPYMGKVIKMAGYYSAFKDEESGIVYHACVIPDATACCAQGIEFIRPDGYDWPADYPKDGTDIVVTGRLEKYEEDGLMYLHLTDTDMVWQKEEEKQS